MSLIKQNQNSIAATIVFGYIKRIKMVFSDNYIPKDVQLIILLYYGTGASHNFFYVFTSSKLVKNPGELHVYDLVNKNVSKIELGVTKPDVIGLKRNYASLHYMNNVYLPKCFLLNNNTSMTFHKYKTYNMLAIIGGHKSSRSSKIAECNVLLFDSISDINNTKNHQIYNYVLPSFPHKITSSAVQLYNNILFTVGGLGREPKKTIFALDLYNIHVSLDNMEWKDISNSKYLISGRYAASICFLTNNKLMTIAGCDGFAVACKTCELYQFGDNEYNVDYFNKSNQNKSISLASTNYYRNYTNCCRGIGNDENKIGIMGSFITDGGDYKMEIYDINKNEWNVYNGDSKFSHMEPFCWLDDKNKNLFYVGGKKKAVSALGYIEWTDIRTGKWELVDFQKLMEIKDRIIRGYFA